MSSPWSSKLCPKSEGALQLDVKRSCPLPNIGNTCFLNSVIQILFRLAIIKDCVLDYHGTNQLITSLRQLFQQIIDQSSTEKKRKTLLSIQKHIQPQLLDYSLGKQYDSYETLLIFLNAIFEENRQLQKELEIEYTQACRCDEPQILCELFIEKEAKRCSKCMQVLQIKLTKIPECLIVKDLKKTEMCKELRTALKSYNLVSKNIYRGTGNYGHYYTLSKFQKFYELNDERVSEIEKLSFEKEACMFSIYERKGENLYKEKRHVLNHGQNNQENQCCLIDLVRNNPKKSIITLILLIALGIGLGIGIDKAKASSTSSQSNNFEIHNGLNPYKEQTHIKTFLHQVKNFPNHLVNQFASSQGIEKKKEFQGKQKRQKKQNNLGSQEESTQKSRQNKIQEMIA